MHRMKTSKTGKSAAAKQTEKQTTKQTTKQAAKQTTGQVAKKTGKRAAEPVIQAPDFTNPAYYTNRELSWLEFDKRVLEEALDETNPLLERCKFLSIVASNLDEFFMVRIGTLKDMIHAGYEKPDLAGLTPAQQLNELGKEIKKLVEAQYRTFRKDLLPQLRENGIQVILQHEEMTPADAKAADAYFENTVYPVLTPMAVDSSRPFPLIRNKSLNIGALVRKGTEEPEFATVQVPSVLPRLVELPCKEGKRLILLEEIIERNMESLFSGYEIVCTAPFRITRNGDMTIDEDDTEDLLEEIEKQVKLRQRGDELRLEVDAGMDTALLSVILEETEIMPEDVFRIKGPLDLTVLMKLSGLEGYSHLRQAPYTPQPVPAFSEGCDVFEQIRQGDILVHHPYQTFEPVVNFIRQSADDENVLAIKQTLYRVSGNSPIIAALARAAENGKQVTVLVELKARFDEEHNIVWAKMLEKAGCHVIYGLMGLKTHSKITLVVRMEDDGIRRYVHLGTGNYNDATAKLYTDIGLFTCAEAFGEDATAVFNMLSGYSEPRKWNRLSVAPIWLKDRFLYLIGREKENALEGRNARIIAKMNSLSDPDIIKALYEASSAGVRIDLIVRGICCLKTGIPGVSENITVRSIVGNFLEHARIFYFQNDENPEYFCGSSDWMPRNLDHRVEIVFPVLAEELKEELWMILDTQLRDNRKARILQPGGRTYVKAAKGRGPAVSSQEVFCKQAKALAKKAKQKDPKETRTFTPMVPN
ncbi:MAG: RNA degradosome polyphosphate kinase [Lachnospiraceae bacterium]|nr:RNA degradosome polyphosphate kinase [Lachnospiraceae bacterium]